MKRFINNYCFIMLHFVLKYYKFLKLSQYNINSGLNNQMLFTSGSFSLLIFNPSELRFNPLNLDLLNNDHQFKLNLENIITFSKSSYIHSFLEYYQKYQIDWDELYSRLILQDNYNLKKTISFFSETNLNIKIYINGFYINY